MMMRDTGLRDGMAPRETDAGTPGRRLPAPGRIEATPVTAGAGT